MIMFKIKKISLCYYLTSDALPHQAFTDFKAVELTETMRLQLKAPTDPQPSWVYDMAVLPSCNLLIADGENQSLKVVDVQTGRLLSHLHLPSEPLSLCLLPGDRAAVLQPDQKIIQIINTSTDQLKLLEYVNVEGDCRGGLAYMNNKFIVGSSDQQCVASINIKGKLLKSVSRDITGNQLFKHPWYICDTTDKNGPSIYVSDWGTHTITRLSEELEVLQTFRHPTQYGPDGLAAAGGGQLLVRDRDSNSRLRVLDTGTGEFMDIEEEKWVVEVWVGVCVAFCPRLGRVYANHGKLDENNYISVHEIS